MLERMSALVGANPVSLNTLGRLPDQGTNFKSLRKVSPWMREPGALERGLRVDVRLPADLQVEW